MQRTFTIGIEEEFQLLDGETYELRSHVSQMLKARLVPAAAPRFPA